jgi:S-adenosylmethionine:tRNA ribosyltransferase-isomerase
MHREQYFVSEDLARAHAETRLAGGRVVAVGTTTVRCLESAFKDEQLQAGSGDTEIFIYPGIAVLSIDALLTNFHLPESTLIMMVSAIAGQDLIMEAYRHAVSEKYRFFSYGDAMLIDRGSWR